MNTLRHIISRLKAALTGKRLLWGGAGLAIALVLLMLVPTPAHAQSCASWSDVSCHGAHLLTWFFQLLTSLMGLILVLEIDALIRVAQYNNFVGPGPTAVAVGWIVTRDLANMFFIVFLLIIAFDTIIRGGDSTYGYRKTLRRLLIMAVVINFSKTICGIFIDMSQVMLLSFVNGFKAAAAGNFFTAFGINKLMALSKDGGSYTWGMVMAMMFAFIIAAVCVCIMLIMVVMMIFRIVTLWVLIILSPIAFLTSSFPLSSKNYYGEWWGMFKANLTSGPVVAFFIWLALAVAQRNGSNLKADNWAPSSTASTVETAGSQSFQSSKIPTDAADGSDTILGLLITISILLAGLKTASEQDVIGKGVAGKIRSTGAAYLKRAAMAPVGAVTGAAGFAAGAAFNRAKQVGYGVAGAALTRLPGGMGLGGVGAAAKAKQQEIKESRRKAREKFTGTEAQKAEFMTSENYASRVANMKDPKRQMEALKEGLKKPEISAALFDPKTNLGSKAMRNVLQNGDAKEFLEMSKLASTDKNFSKQLKSPAEQATLGEARMRYQDMAEKDANQRGGASEFDQKFVGQLAGMQQPAFVKNDDGTYKRDAQNGKIPVMKDGQQATEAILKDEDLKRMVPKMKDDDIKDLDAAGLRSLTKYMSDAQFTKARESAAGDPKKTAELQRGAEEALKSAKEDGKPPLIASAAKRMIFSGAEKGLDPVSVNMLAKSKELPSLLKNLDRSSEPQLAAVAQVMKAVWQNDPDRAKKMAKQDIYQDFISDKDIKGWEDEESAMSGGAQREANVAAARAAPGGPASAPAAPVTISIDTAAASQLADAFTKRVAQLGQAPKGLSPRADADNQREAASMSAALKELKDAISNSQGRAATLAANQNSLKDPNLSAAGRQTLTASIDRLTKALQDDAKQIQKLQRDWKGKV